jgi:hypothetical protein
MVLSLAAACPPGYRPEYGRSGCHAGRVSDATSASGPADPDAPLPVQVHELAERVGVEAFVDECVALLDGADPAEHAEAVRFLGGRAAPGLLGGGWASSWGRVWGARGLLHVFADRAGPAVVRGLADEQWRVAEMCLKVVARHDVEGAADAAAVLADHPLERVRAAALRALGVVGDTEHHEVVRGGLDDESSAVRLAATRADDRMRARLDLR